MQWIPASRSFFSGDNYDCLVTVDEVEFGRVGAQWLVDQLGGEGNIVMLSGISGVSTSEQRNQGALEVFEQYPGINILAIEGRMYQGDSPSQIDRSLFYGLPQLPEDDWHFILMTDQTSYMFVTGPKVVKTVTGEDITTEDLGGATVHSTKSGVSHFLAENEEEGIALIRDLLSYLPSNNLEEAPMIVCNDPIDRLEDKLNALIPDNPNLPYNMMEVIEAIVDNGKFLEVHKLYARNIIVGFARMGGRSIGIIANQPSFYAGVLDIEASRKAARFVRFCDCFNIPILTLVDVPGFLPGKVQEYGGIITHGAKLMFAYGEATVPKVTVTLRKSYGGAHDVMSCKQLRGDFNYAWPTAQIAVMGAKGAIEILYGKELAAITDAEEKKKFIAEKEEEYNNTFANPYKAASYGYIDDVIEPRNTRFRVIRAFQSLQTKRITNPMKKHSNIPL